MTYEDIATEWQKKKIKTVSDLDTYLSDYRILFAYNSNRIEGAGVSLHDTREIFENGKVINYTGDVRSLFETENQKVCYDFLKRKIVKREPVSGKLILDTQERLMHGCYDESRWSEGERPGKYKKHLYGVGLSAGLEPEDVSDEIDYICNELSDIDTDDIEKTLTAAAYFHCNFEYIHPFADGNGRTGRTLMNYFLMIHDLPPTVIFDEDKKLYYEALSIFDETEKLDGFVSLLKDQTVKTWTAHRHLPSGRKKTFICL